MLLQFQWFHDKEYNACRKNKRRKRALADGQSVRNFDVVDDDDDIYLDYEDEEVIDEVRSTFRKFKTKRFLCIVSLFLPDAHIKMLSK